MGMYNAYIIYKCKICHKYFILMTNEIDYSEEESRYVTCPYHGKHKNIIVVGKHEHIKECMDHASYARVSGRMKQKGR